MIGLDPGNWSELNAKFWAHFWHERNKPKKRFSNEQLKCLDNIENFGHSIGVSILVIIHGAPAVGKLTIARHLNCALGGLLYDNHSSLELIKRKIPYGSSGFADAVWAKRMTFFQNAFSSQQDVIFTLAYEPRKHAKRISSLGKLSNRYNVTRFLVYLYCGMPERLERVTNLDRKSKGKIHDIEKFMDFEEHSNFQSIPNSNISINTELFSPLESSDIILREIRKVK